ncbi:hypothetical protein [Rhizobium grahamii]|nr:hypothetical protein [Rhizobium grahamii]
MRELLAKEAMLIVALRFAIANGMRLTYRGTLCYEPRDFSYWGA